MHFFLIYCIFVAGIRNQSDTNFVPGTQAPMKPRFCLTKIKTGYTAKDGRTYVINDDKTYVFDQLLVPEKGPILTSKLFDGLNSVDAVFERQWDGKTVAISDKR